MSRLRIETMFLSAVLRETAQKIYAEQEATARDWGLFQDGDGDLEKSLKGHFSLENRTGGGKVSMRYLTYARFLDMRDPRRKARKEGYHIYNKIVFGNVYNPTINTLMYGLTEDIRQVISKELEEMYKTDMPYWEKKVRLEQKLGEEYLKIRRNKLNV